MTILYKNHLNFWHESLIWSCNFCLPPSFVLNLYQNALSLRTEYVGAIILLICWHSRKIKEIKPKRLITVKCSVPTKTQTQAAKGSRPASLISCVSIWRYLNYNIIISMNYYTITWYGSVSAQFMILLQWFKQVTLARAKSICFGKLYTKIIILR